MTLEQFLDYLRSDREISSGIAHWKTFAPRKANYVDFPAALDRRLISTLAERGIEQLYTHQASAMDSVLNGEDIVVVTPTASGKTLCYNLPVLDSAMKGVWAGNI